MTPPDQLPSAVTSLLELPPVVRNALGFYVLATALGYPEESVKLVVQIRSPEVAHPATLGTEGPAFARLLVEDRGFMFPIGQPVDRLLDWAGRSKELWRTATSEERAELCGSLAMFGVDELRRLLRKLSESGLPPVYPMGIVLARFEALGVADALRRQPPEPQWLASSRPATSAPSKAPRPPGAPLFTIGKIERLADTEGHLAGVDIDEALARHASGDWGESSYLEENERALASDRAVMSVFRTPKGRHYVIITASGRSVTSVWPSAPCHDDVPERMLVDLVCTYVGTGRASEVPDAPWDGWCCSLPLVGSGEAPGIDEHIAARSLYDKITSLPHGWAPVRFERKMWAIWNAVYGVDFRPLTTNGERVPVEAPDAIWEAAAQRCVDEGIFAWFSVRWESPFVA
ncbi:MAG: hypothetical protein ACTHU0_10315 [Kofleriaceae bacterium]